jgi:heme-binding NEAT domain protein
MRKTLKIFLPMLIAVFALLQISQANVVEAATTYKDGEYTIPFTVLKADGSGSSETNDYIAQSAKLIVKDGQNYMQMTQKNASWWQNYTVGGSGVTTISDGGDTRVVQVAVANPSQLVNGNISVKATVDGKVLYEGSHDVKLKFDVSGVPVADGSTSTAAAASDNKNAAKEDNPKTGDNAPIILFAVALAASGLFLGRKFIFSK